MSFMPAYRAGNPGLWGAAWTPADLGASLQAWWDAERADLITRDGGGLVSSWKDVVGGYNAVQATGAAQPVWDAAAFNGHPGVTFDGVAHELTYPSTTGLPIGATPCEVWAAVSQAALPADATPRYVVGWGGTSGTNNRVMRRTVVTGFNRAAAVAGDSGAAIASGNPAVDFSSRHVARAVFSGAAATMYLDGVAGSSTAVTPATLSTRLRIGATTAASASGFWQGTLSAVIFTAPLDATQAGQMYGYLGGRL